jgi:hypothetical protein
MQEMDTKAFDEYLTRIHERNRVDELIAFLESPENEELMFTYWNSIHESADDSDFFKSILQKIQVGQATSTGPLKKRSEGTEKKVYKEHCLI